MQSNPRRRIGTLPGRDKSGRAKVKTYPGGVSIRYSPVNQAYFVMWNDQVLAIKSSRREAEVYAEEITGQRALAANPRRRLSKKCQGVVSRTIKKERHKGVPQQQAIAIGYSKARAAGCSVPAPRMLENPTAFWGKYSV